MNESESNKNINYSHVTYSGECLSFVVFYAHTKISLRTFTGSTYHTNPEHTSRTISHTRTVTALDHYWDVTYHDHRYVITQENACTLNSFSLLLSTFRVGHPSLKLRSSTRHTIKSIRLMIVYEHLHNAAVNINFLKT